MSVEGALRPPGGVERDGRGWWRRGSTRGRVARASKRRVDIGHTDGGGKHWERTGGTGEEGAQLSALERIGAQVHAARVVQTGGGRMDEARGVGCAGG